MSRRDEDLAARVAELEESLRELQRELDAKREPGFPRPPTPREVLRMTDEHAIPAAITFLEAHIRALEALQGLIRITDTRRTAEATDQRIERISEIALTRLDDLMADLQSSSLPNNEDARHLLQEARTLREDIAMHVEEAQSREGQEASEVTEIDIEEELDTGIDIDEELDSIRSDVRGENENDDADQSNGENR